MRVEKPRLILAFALLASVGGVALRVWDVRRDAHGAYLADDRHSFHSRQLEFKSLCGPGVTGKRIEDVLPIFGGLHGFGGNSYGWKAWPCELIVRDGVVQGVFYHDFPFKSQPTPPEYRVTHGRPYFERFPEYLDESFSGRWDGKGGYVFERTPRAD